MVNFSCCTFGLKELIYNQSYKNNIINEVTIKKYWEHVKECEICLESFNEFNNDLPPMIKMVLSNYLRGL